MTRTAERLGNLLDRPPSTHLFLQYGTGIPEREMLPGVEDEARAQGDDQLAIELGWERGIMDLDPLRMPDDDLLPQNADGFRQFYGITDATRAYAIERATETENPILRVHHLAYARATIPQTGREWVDLSRRLANALREYVDFVLHRLEPEADGGDIACLVNALPLVSNLANLPGVFKPSERQDWVSWLLTVAVRLRNHDWSKTDYNQPHRWPFEVLRRLTDFPSKFIGPETREAALTLVSEAYAFFAAESLASSLSTGAAEVEHELRRHFGEKKTHEAMVRRAAEALKRHAEFFANHGHHLGAAMVFREATKVMHSHGQHFTDAERSATQSDESSAITEAVAAGQFKLGGRVSFDMTSFDFTGETPAETVTNLAKHAVDWLPSIEDVSAAVQDTAIEDPLVGIFPSTTIVEDRVVGEAITPEQRQAAGVVRYLVLHGEAIGTLVHATLVNASDSQDLRVEDVLEAVRTLPLAPGSLPVIETGIKAILRRDYVSAVYTLSPMVEESLRRVLRSAGFDTSVFRTLDLASGASRTDDAALGELLRLEANGRKAADVIGVDLQQYILATTASQIGPNLRNKAGHGLARLNDCTPAHSGLLLHILVCLASRASQSAHETTDG